MNCPYGTSLASSIRRPRPFYVVQSLAFARDDVNIAEISNGDETMLNRARNCGAVLAVVATLVGTNLVCAQEDPNTTAKAGQVYRAKQVLGAKVNIEGDTEVGTVDDIVLDDHGTVGRRCV